MEGSKTRVVNAIHSDLAAVFPEYRTLFDDIATKTSIAVLRRYTLPANISNASADELADVITKASRNHSGKVTARKLRELALSTVGIQDTNGIYLFKMRENVKLLEQLLSIISELDDRIKELSAADRLFLSARMGIESTNNAAERAIRPMVVVRKVSAGNHSDVGAETTSKVANVI